jgi:MerR family transcriptional regulator, thiopeptide resistance regulator
MVYRDAMDTQTVGDVARMAGITVRTLHHYDEIGLLKPSERRANGYRGYTEADITRLQQILAYRELALGLDEIEQLLDETSDPVQALGEARQRVGRHLKKLRRIAARLDSALEAELKGTPMTADEKLDAFNDFDPDEFAAEAADRWADGSAYKESSRRTASYTPDDWRRQQSEAADIYRNLSLLLDEGVPPESAEAAILVDEHRASITRWFYECTPEIHAGLGAMYVADERFRHTINKAGDGLAEYLSEAIAARYART